MIQFDKQKLDQLDSIEKKQLYFFQYLSNLDKEIPKKVILQEHQAEIEQILTANLTTIALNNKPVTALVSRCLVSIYQHGNLRSLYDVASLLVNSLTGAKESDLKMYVDD
jgi:HEAT repeat-containing protein 5